MTQTHSQCQVLIVLDRQVALESLILNRLLKIPDERQQEWLRGLLLDGFRLACHVLRMTASEAGVLASNHDARASALKSQPSVLSPSQERKPHPELMVHADKKTCRDRMSAAGQPKPFAQLQKVMG